MNTGCSDHTVVIILFVKTMTRCMGHTVAPFIKYIGLIVHKRKKEKKKLVHWKVQIWILLD